MRVILSSRPVMVRLTTWVYQAVLVLYPSIFRAEFGDEMLFLFQERCYEVYKSGGTGRLFQWFLLIFVEELGNVYKEYQDMMEEISQSRQDARGTIRLGVIYLAGTWVAFFVLAGELFPMMSRGIAGLLPGVVLVLINALFVFRALTRSRRFEYVPGMVAVSNTFLFASLLAVEGWLNGSLAFALILQGTLLFGHGWLLWQLRGEDFFTDSLPEFGEVL